MKHAFIKLVIINSSINYCLYFVLQTNDFKLKLHCRPITFALLAAVCRPLDNNCFSLDNYPNIFKEYLFEITY